MRHYFSRLQDISQDKRAGEGNMSTILERMKPLIEETVEDIKSCANMCDTYTKRTRISKVMHRASWNELFERYIQIFAGRRREFMLAMSMDIRHAVNTANDKPATTKKQCVLSPLWQDFSNSELTIPGSGWESTIHPTCPPITAVPME